VSASKGATSRRTTRKTAAKPRTPPTIPLADYLPMTGDIDPKLNGGRKRSAWLVKRTGDYTFDCYLGHELARLTLRAMRTGSNPTLLGGIIADMVRGGVWGGVEVGFTYTIAEAAMRGGVGL
jgi:hypothetical protein